MILTDGNITTQRIDSLSRHFSSHAWLNLNPSSICLRQLTRLFA